MLPVPQSEDGEISLLSLECILYFPGYVQGMSDLLSPILFLMEDEVEAFWCFVGFMEKVVGANPCGPALQVTTVPVDITTTEGVLVTMKNETKTMPNTNLILTCGETETNFFVIKNEWDCSHKK